METHCSDSVSYTHLDVYKRQDLYLSLPVSDQRRWNKLARKGIDTEDIDNQMAMIVGLTEEMCIRDRRRQGNQLAQAF